jgi:hypothetical protein
VESECSILAWDNEEQVGVDCSGEGTNIHGYRLSLPESYPKLQGECSKSFGTMTLPG